MADVVVAGAAGRMGNRLVALLQEDKELRLVAALEAPGHPALGRDAGEAAGVGRLTVPITADPEAVLGKDRILIEFSVPEASLAHARLVARQGGRAVIGTTGFTAAQREELAAIGRSIAILVAPNMSVGVNVAFRILADMARMLGDDYDVEIVETHHRFKKDAPSGTALRMAEVVAQALGRDLIRLQCYEGLDIAQAAYEWNYSRQMIEIRMAEAEGVKSREGLSQDIFSERFLVRRPLLRALEGVGAPPVLLIDELDRTDEPFEAYLLEVLSDWQITIPELGTIRAEEPPIVVITSNRTREIHDAVKRRCFYHWVDYPDAARELEILRRKAPKAADGLSKEVVAFVQRLRGLDLFKLPGVAETIDWANCLVALDRLALDPETVNNTLGVLLKYQDDIEKVAGEEAARLVSEAKSAAAAA